MRIFIVLIMLAVLPGMAAATEAKPSAQASKVSSSSAWSPAERRFWKARASETRRINRELWSVRVQLEGERLARIDTPAMQARALAYQQPGAPNYIRLRDGEQARSLAELVKVQDIEGVTVLAGRVLSVEDGILVLRVRVAPTRTKKITGLSEAQQAHYAAVIRPIKDPQPSSWIPTREVEKKIVFVDVPAEPVTPEALRAACAEMKLTAFPDFRPVFTGEAVDSSGSPRDQILQAKRHKNATYTRQDFTWHAHPVIIPMAMR